MFRSRYDVVVFAFAAFCGSIYFLPLLLKHWERYQTVSTLHFNVDLFATMLMVGAVGVAAVGIFRGIVILFLVFRNKAHPEG